MKQTLAYIILIVLMTMAALSLIGFYAVIRPARLISTVTPEHYHLSYEDISFTTEDHIQLKGWFIPSTNTQAKTIILLHGYPADKGDILASRLFLHKDYNLLFFDFRYMGQSGGNYSTVGKDEVLDLQAAIRYLHTRGINEVGVWGFSLGSAVALMAAPVTPEIKVVVAESGYARLDWLSYDYFYIPVLRYPLGLMMRFWGVLFLHSDIANVSPLRSAEKINIPVLLIHSKKDNFIPFKHALALEKALKHDPQLTVYFVDDALHGGEIKNYQHIVSEFLYRYFNHPDS